MAILGGKRSRKTAGDFYPQVGELLASANFGGTLKSGTFPRLASRHRTPPPAARRPVKAAVILAGTSRSADKPAAGSLACRRCGWVGGRPGTIDILGRGGNRQARRPPVEWVRGSPCLLLRDLAVERRFTDPR
jgi:hypothetical protein